MPFDTRDRFERSTAHNSVEESPKCEERVGKEKRKRREETRARRKQEEERPWLLVLLGARRKMPSGTK